MKFKPTFVTLIEDIRVAKSPANAAALGRNPEVAPYLRTQWDGAWRVFYMRRALMAKFTQHPDLTSLLLSTEDAELIEHTTKDSYWGDGGDGSEENMLGQLLMSVKDEIRSLTPSDRK